MSALDVYEAQRESVVSGGAFSEEFSWSGGTFFGIFDHSWAEVNRDAGNVEQSQRRPRIMVAELPVGLAVDNTITRVRDATTFGVHSLHDDPTNVSVVWLY